MREREEARMAAMECMSSGPQMIGTGGVPIVKDKFGKEEIGRASIHSLHKRTNPGCAVVAH